MRVIREVVEAKGRVLKFLTPYSPGYNPIKSLFSMLKAWMRRCFRRLRASLKGDFGGFLYYTIVGKFEPGPSGPRPKRDRLQALNTLKGGPEILHSLTLKELKVQREETSISAPGLALEAT